MPKRKDPRLLDEYMTEPEAAAELGLSPKTLARMRRRREGPPFVQIGRNAHYRRTSVASWLLDREIAPVRRGRPSRC